MKNTTRYLKSAIGEDSKNKMVFLGGPRQVHLGQKDYGNSSKGGRVIPFAKFCIEEEMI